MKAIVCGKLFDSVKGSMQRDRILFVEDKLIAGNESYSQSKIPSDVEIIDFNDSNHPNTEKLLFGFIFLNLDIFPVLRG